MKKITKNKDKMSAGKVAVVGAGIAAVGAGAYYLLGPKGKDHQKKAKVWMVKMQKDVSSNYKKIKSVTKPLYHSTVDTVAKTYSKQYDEYKDEINAFAKKLKSEWKTSKPKTKAKSKSKSKLK